MTAACCFFTSFLTGTVLKLHDPLELAEFQSHTAFHKDHGTENQSVPGEFCLPELLQVQNSHGTERGSMLSGRLSRVLLNLFLSGGYIGVQYVCFPKCLSDRTAWDHNNRPVFFLCHPCCVPSLLPARIRTLCQ